MGAAKLKLLQAANGLTTGVLTATVTVSNTAFSERSAPKVSTALAISGKLKSNSFPTPELNTHPHNSRI